MIFNLMDRPVVTLTEATMILGLSASTIKRRLESGQIKQVERKNMREKILIHTDSIKKYLEECR
tara:strand:+ start:262 stop:453 length:192 start_codon:yes stop_codon:yes gene_type:complete